MDLEFIRDLAEKSVKLAYAVDALSTMTARAYDTIHKLGHIVDNSKHTGPYEDCNHDVCVGSRIMMDQIRELYVDKK